MKTYSKFKEESLSVIRPAGWLETYLKKQRDGLTGHLEVAGYPFDRMGWGAQENVPSKEAFIAASWWPYEQTGYWIDGMIRCGYLLDDETLIRKANRNLDYVLSHQDPDGYLGPACIKEPKNRNRWAHAVFFRAFMARYSATGEENIVTALQKHYLSGTSPHSEQREVCNIEEMLWTYGQTGERALLAEAVRTYEQYNRKYRENDTSIATMQSEKKSTEHGVTFNEIAKLGAVLYIYTGNEEYLDATKHAYEKLDRDQMLIDGVCSSSEFLRGKDPLDSHETCDIADYTWSMGYLLMATGEARYADKIEYACFNAAPGAVRSDFKGLQYFSCPNQVIADAHSNHNRYHRGSKWMSYRPNPGTECCPGQVNRIMPNYVSRMWMRAEDNGIAAVLYGPSGFDTVIGDHHVEITEETGYPFSEDIDFIIHMEKPTRFALVLRIPAWCEKAQVSINGRKEAGLLGSGTFVRLDRTFEDQDRITLKLPMHFEISRWPHHGVGLRRGPLVYAQKIEERWEIDQTEKNATEAFPAWNLYPASAWNYGLHLAPQDLDSQIQIMGKEATDEPWSIHSSPIEIKVPAKRIDGWTLDRSASVVTQTNDAEGNFTDKEIMGDFTMTPQLPDEELREKSKDNPVEYITLVPYGCTKLRISIFPEV